MKKILFISVFVGLFSFTAMPTSWAQVCGDGIYQPSAEQCGEPGAPACVQGQQCIGCKCLTVKMPGEISLTEEMTVIPTENAEIQQKAPTTIPKDTVEISIGTCGNGSVDSGEGCDWAAHPTGCAYDQGCTLGCQCQDLPRTAASEPCGNNLADQNELCEKTFSQNQIESQCKSLFPNATMIECTDNCICKFCGDGVLDASAGEQCGEPGAPTCASGSICVNCQCLPSCGQYGWDQTAGEECDVPMGADPAISEQCMISNNLISPPADATCDGSCKCHYCGDGVKDATEQCEADSDCPLAGQHCGYCYCITPEIFIAPVCGDGQLNQASEQCDPGPVPATDATCGLLGWCTAQCQCEYCGDGLTNANESCDPADPNFDPATDCPTGPNANSCDPATCTCIFPYCGDGNIDPGEQCEGTDTGTCPPDGMNRPAKACTNCLCAYGTCGDGTVEGNEQCDGSTAGCPPDGMNRPAKACTNCLCAYGTCGDGTVEGNEQCEAGLLTNCPGATPPLGWDGCNAACECVPKEGCGDSNVVAPEDCDPPGSMTCSGGTRACQAGCTCPAPMCGDNIIDANEICDPPGSVCGPGGIGFCTAGCKCSYCGNDAVDMGEGCDQVFGTIVYNTTQPNICPATQGAQTRSGCDLSTCACEYSPPPTAVLCPNGVIDPGEDCDPPNKPCPGWNGMCDGSCHCEVICGDGYYDQATEQCSVSGPAGSPQTERDQNGNYVDCPGGLACGFCKCQTPGRPSPFCGDGNRDPGEECGDPDVAGITVCPDPNQVCVDCKCLDQEEVPFCGDFIVNQATEQCDADPSDPAAFAQAMETQCGNADAVCVECACVVPKPGCPPDGCCPPTCGEEPQPEPIVGEETCIIEYTGAATPGALKELEKINDKINKEAFKDTPLFNRVRPVGEAEFTSMKMTVFLPGTVAEGPRTKAIQMGDVSMGPWMVTAKGARLNDFWVKKYKPEQAETMGWTRLAPLTEADFTAAGKALPAKKALKTTLKNILLPDLSSEVATSLGIEAGGTIDSVLSLGADAQVVSNTMVKVNNVTMVEISPLKTAVDVTNAAKAAASGLAPFKSVGTVTSILQPIAASFTGIEGYGGYKGANFDVDRLIEAIKANVSAMKAEGKAADCSVLMTAADSWPEYQNYGMKFVQDQLPADPNAVDITQTTQSGAFFGINLSAAKGTGGCSLTGAVVDVSGVSILIGMALSGIAGIIVVRRRKK